MKTRILLFFVGLLALSFVDLIGHSNGAGRGGLLRSTGAPGETHCGACHTDGVYNGEMFVHEVSQGAVLTGYVPGATHVFLVEILSADTFVNGGMQFQIVDSLGNKAGSFLPGNTANATIAIPWNYQFHQYIEQPRPIYPVMVGGARKIYIGAAWIANPLYDGPVTFYASGTICNGDSTANGDNSYNKELTLYPRFPLEASQDSTETVIPQLRAVWAYVEETQLFLGYAGADKDLIFYEVFDGAGNVLLQGKAFFEPADRKALKLPAHSAGLYFVRTSGIKSPIGIQKVFIP